MPPEQLKIYLMNCNERDPHSAKEVIAALGGSIIHEYETPASFVLKINPDKLSVLEDCGYELDEIKGLNPE